MTKQLFALADVKLDEVSGGAPNLGGYTYCNKPGVKEGLYVGGCPITSVDVVNAFVAAFHKASGTPG
jgi:hypothetical protein